MFKIDLVKKNIGLIVIIVGLIILVVGLILAGINYNFWIITKDPQFLVRFIINIIFIVILGVIILISGLLLYFEKIKFPFID